MQFDLDSDTVEFVVENGLPYVLGDSVSCVPL